MSKQKTMPVMVDNIDFKTITNLLSKYKSILSISEAEFVDEPKCKHYWVEVKSNLCSVNSSLISSASSWLSSSINIFSFFIFSAP